MALTQATESTRQFTSNRFYSGKDRRRHHELEKHIKKREQQFREQNLPTAFPARITGPSRHWRCFHRQQDAFDFCHSKAEELHVFAYESETMGGGGQRMFLVTSLPHFWHYYSQLKEGQRHHYEVIPSGAVCKLYLDLEFPKENNPLSDGSKMVDTVIKYVCLWLHHLFKVTCTRQDVLDLDASTMKKFSRHLIFQLPNAAFQNNVVAGQFISIFSLLLARVQACTGTSEHSELSVPHGVGETDRALLPNATSDAASTEAENTPTADSSHDADRTLPRTLENSALPEKEIGSEMLDPVSAQPAIQPGALADQIFQHFSDEELKCLIVNNKDGNPSLFCDLGVYTKNRNFRLYQSSKLGQQNPLVVAAENCFQPDVCTAPPAADPLHQGRASTSSLSPDTDYPIFLSSLVANVPYSSNIRILTMEGKSSRKRKLSFDGSSCNDNNKVASDVDAMEGFLRSPYPEVDAFIGGLVGGEGRGGRVRCWVYFSRAEVLTYDIVGYRWCHNVQRQHRSNNILMVADLRRGVFYQKCHDPDCRAQNFKSPDEPLPTWVLPAHFFDAMDAEEDAEEEEMGDDSGDELCLLAAQALEEEGDSDSDLDLVAAAECLEKSVTA